MRGLPVGRREIEVLGAVLGMLAATGLGSQPPQTSATDCSDVEVVFARGTAESAGLGMVGRPFAEGLRSGLPGKTVTSYAVRYEALLDQSSAADGAADLTRHVIERFRECPLTRFVLGGYSQGASVVDIVTGAVGALGESLVLPESVLGRVRALVVFGNPLRLAGRQLDTLPGAFQDRSLDLCTPGDPVCAGGADPLAHLRYPRDGSVDRAVRFAVAQVLSD
jgi:cutinase